MKHARLDYDRIQDPSGKIPANEPVFLLRAQDETAADVVRYWAMWQPEGEIREMAFRHAELMDEWPMKKAADLPAAGAGEDV